MPSPRTAILGALGKILPVLGPGKLDQVVSQVTIRTRTWSGGDIDVGTFSDSDLVLPQVYFISQMTAREVAQSGGAYAMDDLKVEGILPADPANPGVGFYPSQLKPTIVDGQELIYVVAGTHNGEYSLRELRTTDAYGYDLVLSRRLTTPQVLGPLDAAAGEHE